MAKYEDGAGIGILAFRGSTHGCAQLTSYTDLRLRGPSHYGRLIVSNVDNAVAFLLSNDALALGHSPWPTYRPDEEVHQIDWDRLFPPDRHPDGSGWRIEPSGAELEDLRATLRNSGLDSSAAHQKSPNADGAFAAPEWDMCAWYQPVHFFGNDWGIFIKEASIARAALGIAGFVRDPPDEDEKLVVLFNRLCLAAMYIYFLHEQYHHKVECFGLRLHVVRRTTSYLKYHKRVYTKAQGTDDQLEEALANADCFLRLNTRPYATWLTPQVVSATQDYLRGRFPSDPPGYRKAIHYLTRREFDAGENVLQARVKEASLTPEQPVAEWDLAPRMTQSFFPVTSSIWTVVPVGTKSRLPLKPVAPLRTCTTQEMVELYEREGYCEVDGGKGSHIKLKKPGAPTMILPGDRRELSPGVAKTALKVLGDFNISQLPGLLARGRQSRAGR